MHRVRLLALLLRSRAAGRAGSAERFSHIVVSQVYGGGGNSGATYANDFVELFNRGATAVDLGTWSIQYALAAPDELAGDCAAGSVQPGVTSSSSSRPLRPSAALPTPDATGTTNLANVGREGRVVRSATALTCGASAGSCSADPPSSTSSVRLRDGLRGRRRRARP